MAGRSLASTAFSDCFQMESLGLYCVLSASGNCRKLFHEMYYWGFCMEGYLLYARFYHQCTGGSDWNSSIRSDWPSKKMEEMRALSSEFIRFFLKMGIDKVSIYVYNEYIQYAE